MAGRFRLFTDNHIQEAVSGGLRRRGWDVVRAIDVFPERTPDPILFEHAAKDGRVLVTNDRGIQKIGAAWLDAARPFPGLIFWPQEDYAAMTTGEIIQAFEFLTTRQEPFAYPMQAIRPPSRSPLRARFKRSGRRKRGQ